MKTYTFTRDLNLGIVQISVKKGEIVTEKNGTFIYNNQKYDNTRDFQIALEKGWLVDSEEYVQTAQVVQNKTNNFGFKIQKQQQEVVSISINKFKQNILNEEQGFVEDGQEIKSLEDSGIHVAKATDVKSVEQSKQAVKETQSDVEKKDDKTIEKKKATVKTQEKAAKKETVKQSKKEQTKKSRIIKDSEIGKQQVVGEVMGMKIIKGE